MFYAIALSRYSLALVFAVAAVGKIRARADFEGSVRAMVGVPAPYAPRLAGAVIVGEFVAAALLCVPRVGPVGALLAGVLLSAFTALILRLIVRRESVACSCFGASGAPAGWVQVGRNVLLSAMAAVGAFRWSPVPSRPGLLTVAFAAVAVAALVASLEEVIFLILPSSSGPGTYDLRPVAHRS